MKAHATLRVVNEDGKILVQMDEGAFCTTYAHLTPAQAMLLAEQLVNIAAPLMLTPDLKLIK